LTLETKYVRRMLGSPRRLGLLEGSSNSMGLIGWVSILQGPGVSESPLRAVLPILTFSRLSGKSCYRRDSLTDLVRGGPQARPRDAWPRNKMNSLLDGGFTRAAGPRPVVPYRTKLTSARAEPVGPRGLPGFWVLSQFFSFPKTSPSRFSCPKGPRRKPAFSPPGGKRGSPDAPPPPLPAIPPEEQ